MEALAVCLIAYFFSAAMLGATFYACWPVRAEFAPSEAMNSGMPGVISALELELIELDQCLIDAKGDAKKALSLARVGIVSQLEIACLLRDNDLPAIRDTLEGLQETLDKRRIPCGRDLKGDHLNGTPTPEVIIREQIYRCVLEGM